MDNRVLQSSFMAFDAVSEWTYGNPDQAWAFILEACTRNLSTKQSSMLAAGPLEDLLANSGPMVIARVELEAQKNPKFRSLLTGVWQNQMSDTVWARVQAAAQNTSK